MKFTRPGHVYGRMANAPRLSLWLARAWNCRIPGLAGGRPRAKLEGIRRSDAAMESALRKFVYADREGNISERSIGLAPLRKNWTGLLPVPGAGGYEWSGFRSNH